VNTIAYLVLVAACLAGGAVGSPVILYAGALLLPMLQVMPTPVGTLAASTNVFLAGLMASAVTWLGHAQGWVHTVLAVLASAALGLWAGDELLRGVNPFRRLLGLAILAWLGFSLVRLWLTP